MGPQEATRSNLASRRATRKSNKKTREATPRRITKENFKSQNTARIPDSRYHKMSRIIWIGEKGKLRSRLKSIQARRIQAAESRWSTNQAIPRFPARTRTSIILSWPFSPRVMPTVYCNQRSFKNDTGKNRAAATGWREVLRRRFDGILTDCPFFKIIQNT